MKTKLFDIMKTYAYRFSEEQFTLASGKKSHHYFNCKELLLYPDRLEILANYLVSTHVPELGFQPEAIGGLTMGADPICYSMSLVYQREGILVYPLTVRKETKDHGTKKQIEGATSKVSTCLVVDDVITTGGSTLKAVEALRSADIQVNKCVCILDREEGGRENLEREGIELHPIFRKSDFALDKSLP